MLKKSIIVLLLSAAIPVVANASAIAWGASEGDGFSTLNGAELAPGNYALLGTFNISDTVIQQNQTNLAFLQQHFTQFDVAQIGQGLGISPAPASNFAATKTFDTTTLAGTQLYYWVFASTDNTTQATSFSTAFQDGIFYVDKSDNSAWGLPAEAIGSGTGVDISDLANGTTLIAAAHVVLGSFPDGTSTVGQGSPNFGLVPSPEPSSVALLGMGAFGLLARRRRNS